MNDNPVWHPIKVIFVLLWKHINNCETVAGENKGKNKKAC